MEYPSTDVAIADMKIVLDIFRNGQLTERRAEFAQAAVGVLAFIVQFAFGEPSQRQPLIAGLPQQVTNDAEAVEVLDMLTGESDGRQRALSIPPEIWQGLFAWLMQRLLEALSKRGK